MMNTKFGRSSATAQNGANISAVIVKNLNLPDMLLRSVRQLQARKGIDMITRFAACGRRDSHVFFWERFCCDRSAHDP
jgi:hypothetical protein